MRAHSLLQQLLPQALPEPVAARLRAIGRPSADQEDREKVPDVQARSTDSRAHPRPVAAPSRAHGRETRLGSVLVLFALRSSQPRPSESVPTVLEFGRCCIISYVCRDHRSVTVYDWVRPDTQPEIRLRELWQKFPECLQRFPTTRCGPPRGTREVFCAGGRAV